MSTSTDPIPVLGLTGGIGSGKSTALAYLHELGAATISSDDIVHGLYSTADVIDLIREHFGDVVVDGAGGVSRPALAGIVFSDEAELRWLEDLLHPFVRDAVATWVDGQQRARPRPALIVVEVPLLFETGFDQRFDHIMLITAPDDVRRKRVTAKLTDSEFRRRRAQQMPEEEKIARSDFVFDNSGSRKDLREFVGQAVARILAGEGPGRGGRRPRDRLVRRLFIGLVVLAAGLAAVVAAVHWVAPLFASGSGPSWYPETVYPLEHAGAIRAGAARYDLDPALVAAVVYAESRFDEHARSSQGAVGLMQVLPETAAADRRRVRRREFTTGGSRGPAHQRALRVLLSAQGARRLRRRSACGGRLVQRRHGRRERVGRRGTRRRS